MRNHRLSLHSLNFLLKAEMVYWNPVATCRAEAGVGLRVLHARPLVIFGWGRFGRRVGGRGGRKFTNIDREIEREGKTQLWTVAHVACVAPPSS